MSTYSNLQYHLIFSTKNRVNLIDPSWQDDLHRYIGGTVRGLGGTALAIGGVQDHVHVLVTLKPTHRLADFMRDLKRSTSLWASAKQERFAWQEGYAAFSVAFDGIPAVKAYIQNQASHHHKMSSLEELLALLEEHRIEFDMKYLE